MEKNYTIRLFLFLSLFIGFSFSSFALEVSSVSPANKATGVDPSSSVRLEMSQPVNVNTLNSSSVRLKKSDGTILAATLNTDLTKSAITLSPNSVLQAQTTYTVEVTSSLKNASGGSATPFTSTFKTGNIVSAGAAFKYNRFNIHNLTQSTSVAIGPDDHLYVSFRDGKIRRYILDLSNGKPTSNEVVADIGKQIIGITFDPDATANNLLLWISYSTLSDYAGNTGTVSRLKLPSVGSSGFTEQKYIIGLPHPEDLAHQPNGLAFDDNEVLYQAVGGVTTLGGTHNWGAPEDKLSAAIIYMDVKKSNFNGGKLPVNVNTKSPNNYDPYAANAPVKIYATGIRNALDMVFHSNGKLYTATNQNSISGNVKTPSGQGVPAINARPREMLYIVQKGKYYGHPNPSRGEYVLNGGNPTSGWDPFEVSAYPTGTKPDPDFDPSLIYDIRDGGGNSANGMAEYKGGGALNGRLLVAYYTGTKTINTFKFNDQGKVMEEKPLEYPDGSKITFVGALDVAIHPKILKVYVADYGTQSYYLGNGGAVYMLDPAGAPVASFTASPSSGGAPLTVSFNASASTDPNNDPLFYSWDFGDGKTGTGETVSHTFTSSGTYLVKLKVEDNKGYPSITSKTITVNTGGSNNAPVASFTASPESGQAPLSVSFTNTSSDPDGDNITYSWNFGDGSTSTSKNPSHTFTAAGSFTVKLKVTDSKDASHEATKVITVNSASTSSEVLFVVGNTNLSSSDQAMKNRLENQLGYTVVVKSASSSAAGDATGKKVVLISASVNSGAVQAKFTNVSVPVVSCESWLFDDLKMTTTSSSQFGLESSQTQVSITSVSHSLTAGLSGTVTVFSSGADAYWGKPNSNAVVAATISGNAEEAALFGYEAGASMVGMTAPARRVGLFVGDNAGNVLSSNGLKLFDAAIQWAAGVSTSARKAPTVEREPLFTTYPNPTNRYMTVNLPAGVECYGFTLTTLAGSRVKGLHRKKASSQLDLASVPNGVYILEVHTSKGLMREPIVVQK